MLCDRTLGAASITIAILLISFGSAIHAQTATSVNISGPMTITIDSSYSNASATISGNGTIPGFGAVTATASSSVSISAGTCLTVNGTSIGLGSPGIAPASFTLDYGGGNTMTGTLNMPCSAFVTALNGSSLPSSGSGVGSVTITGGTGKYAGTTGSFPSATMNLTINSVDQNSFTLNCTAQLSGNGTITVPGSGPSQPSSPVGVSPASGSASSQTIQFTFTDPRGTQDLDVVDILINNFLDGRNACYLAYSRSAGTLYLVADNGGTLLPVNGSAATSNSQCSVSISGNFAPSGNNLIGSLTFNFLPAFAGNKVIYMAARDLSGNNSGWQALGVWQVPGFSTFPTAVSVNQARTMGSSQSLTFTFSDTKGAQDLGVLNMLINNFLDGRNACYIAYSQPFKVLYLVGDAGGGLSAGLSLGGSGSVSNSQCTINSSGSVANVSGNILMLTLNISFKTPFDGNRVIYIAARDSTDANNSGWQALGTTTVQ